jgi:hypothetical protein
MRLVEERSLSSILRSELITTLLNNHVSGIVNAGGCARALDEFGMMQTASRLDRLRKRPLSKELVDETI